MCDVHDPTAGLSLTVYRLMVGDRKTMKTAINLHFLTLWPCNFVNNYDRMMI